MARSEVASASRRSSRRSTPSNPPTISSTRSKTQNTQLRRQTIPDSDQEDEEGEAQSPPGSRRTTRNTASFKGVFVTNMNDSSLKRPLPKRKSRSSASSVDSPVDSMQDSSDDFSTPATTPATSVASANSAPNTNLNTGTHGKRKRQIVDLFNEPDDQQMDTSNDARLAQELQEHEYDLDPSQPGKKKSRFYIDDSEGESDLSSVITEDTSDVFIAGPSRSKPRKVSDSKTSKLSSRKNRAGPAKDDQDSIMEDSSVLSEVDMDLDSIAVSEEDYFIPTTGDEDESGEGEADDSDAVAAGDVVITSGVRRRAPMTHAEYQANRIARNKMSRMERERARLEASHPEIKTMWQDLKAVPKIKTEQSPQPESITRKLKTFQLEGLNWMQKQEQTQWKGGLLGDEMGMGKTIQAVSLIMSDYPAKEPTLVVVPPVALMQWTNEINEYTNGKLKVLVYHGTNAKAKNMTVKELKKFNVIMISYSGLESIYRKQVKGWTRNDKIIKEDSAIHSIHYHRLILDEAHSIKSRTTGVAKACFALKGTYKWCLSGTPVQNRIGEFFSLLRFLNVQPFANYFCKNCSCSSLEWSVGPDYRCKDPKCNHRALDHVSVFNQEILNPITSTDSDSVRKDAFGKLRLLTERIMLRRMKRDQTASMELPPKEIVVRNEFFGEIERDFSSSIMTNTTRQFDTYVSRGVMLNNYANIFGLIMQMRQVADHPDLLLKKHSETGQNVLVCNICDEVAEDAIRSRCKHEFCRTCVKDYVKSCEGSGAVPDCPRCHLVLNIDFDQPEIEQDEDVVKKNSIINRIKMENWTSSTKIEMLVYELYKLRSNKQTLKSIVFSQFTSMLQLIEWRLRRAGFNTVMLDGSMTPQQRQKSIDYFMNNADVEVFLVSLKAGGVALNLTEASRVFIVDPWWNPAAEWQSADRCHRIGQKRPCVITRLCIEDSVESRIVMLQEKKAHLINSTVNNDDVAMEKLSPEDMQFLFRGS